MSTSRYISTSDAETRRIAAEFAASLHGGEKISLIGPLGSGKTTFVRGFVEAFGISTLEVASPTFTLVREYENTKKIYHVDLYRFEKEDDIFEAGIYEIIAGEDLVLIEWADRLDKYFPEDSVTIRFSHTGPEERSIEISQG